MITDAPLDLDDLTSRLSTLEQFLRTRAVTSHQRNLVGQLTYLRRHLADFSPEAPPAVRRHVLRYGSGWERLRVQVLARDECRCTQCGENWLNYLEIHHIVPIGQGGTNDPSNLITLCRLCHAKLHGAPSGPPPAELVEAEVEPAAG